MGSFIGHFIPGLIFTLAGVWWFYHVLLEYTASLRRQHKFLSESQRAWRRCYSHLLRNIPVEPLIKILIPIAGVFVELGGARFKLHDENNISNVNDFGHASMYGFFALSGLVDTLNFYKLADFSREMEYCVFGFAFCIECALFYFHLHGRDMFDVRIHTILCLVVFGIALVIFLEAALKRHRRELFMVRTILLLTQGTWFFEISCTIYGPTRWFVDANTDLTEEELAFDTGIMTVSVCWHILSWSLALLGCCSFVSCLHRRERLLPCCLVSKSSGIQRESIELDEEGDDEEKNLLCENERLNSNDGQDVNENTTF